MLVWLRVGIKLLIRERKKKGGKIAFKQEGVLLGMTKNLAKVKRHQLKTKNSIVILFFF
jgi:hypothetical protein